MDLAEEDFLHEDPWICAQRTAREKALTAFEHRPDCLVIAGDTVVAYDSPTGWVQLAKPLDEEDAKSMLRQLSGRSHKVITGIALRWPKGLHGFSAETTVGFRELSSEEIEKYVATGEPMDKAGAYAIQGGAAAFVERIEGSFTNVVGLPLELLEEALKEIR